MLIPPSSPAAAFSLGAEGAAAAPPALPFEPVFEPPFEPGRPGDAGRAPRREPPLPPPAPGDWQALLLDQVDYPTLMVSAQMQVLHANKAALKQMQADYPLCIRAGRLALRGDADAGPLQEAVRAACDHEKRKLLQTGGGSRGPAVVVSVVPLSGAQGARAALLKLSKPSACEPLSIIHYARQHGLTGAEAKVLAALCDGLAPQEIAAGHGVAIATVRSQLVSIREKTGSGSLDELMQALLLLPPLVSALSCLA